MISVQVYVLGFANLFQFIKLDICWNRFESKFYASRSNWLNNSVLFSNNLLCDIVANNAKSCCSAIIFNNSS